MPLNNSAPTTSQLMRFSVQASRQSIGASDSPQVLYLLVDLRPPETFVRQRLPLNIGLVLDRSTSMKGERLDRARIAARYVVDHLAPEDLISIVTFSDRAEIVVPGGPVGHKQQVAAQLSRIRAAGATEIYQGLEAALGQIRQGGGASYLNHLILLTDGHTYGDADHCLELAAEAARQGIGFSAFGIGTEWNDVFLDQLVAPSGGRSGYIESAEQILVFLKERIRGLGAIFAHDVQLRLDLPTAINVKDIFKVAPFAQPLPPATSALRLGTLEGASPLTLLLELTVEPQAPGASLPLTLTVSAEAPGQNPPHIVVKEHMTLPVLADDAPTPPPAAIVEAGRVLQMYRMHEQARSDLEAGQVETARRRMDRLTTRLQEAGFDQLAAQAQREAQQLATQGTMSIAGEKMIKYGTRALMTQTLKRVSGWLGDR